MFVPFGNAFAHVRGVRARPRTFAICPMRCALRIGLDGGRLGGALCRCAVGIGGGCVVSDAQCRWDWPVLGLSGGSVTSLVGIGGRRVVSDAVRRWYWPVSGLFGGSVIGGEDMVWVSLCRCDWRGERGVGSSVQL